MMPLERPVWLCDGARQGTGTVQRLVGNANAVLTQTMRELPDFVSGGFIYFFFNFFFMLHHCFFWFRDWSRRPKKDAMHWRARMTGEHWLNWAIESDGRKDRMSRNGNGPIIASMHHRVRTSWSLEELKAPSQDDMSMRVAGGRLKGREDKGGSGLASWLNVCLEVRIVSTTRTRQRQALAFGIECRLV
ncbi:hypothetical protein IWZ03DRAFT_370812 [Phyllosticta citriasiana]|uniref:Uncharacterized protein n=1 Tax=Phyllosticta citriasiana TaxID=595635 RepID=A0ABR1KVT2_9PEZI